MNILKKIVVAVLLLTFAVFVAFFGRLPALRYVSPIFVQMIYLTSLRKTPIGILHRLLFVTLPELVHKGDIIVTGGRVTPALWRSGHYLMDENHPIVLVRSTN